MSLKQLEMPSPTENTPNFKEFTKKLETIKVTIKLVSYKECCAGFQSFKKRTLLRLRAVLNVFQNVDFF